MLYLLQHTSRGRIQDLQDVQGDCHRKEETLMEEKLKGGFLIACWLIEVIMWGWAIILLLKEADNDRGYSGIDSTLGSGSDTDDIKGI